jgi:hypothetical protein
LNENQRILNKLQAIADRANATNSHQIFFQLLRAFSELILLNPAFKKVLKVIFDRGKNAMSPLVILAKRRLR